MSIIVRRGLAATSVAVCLVVLGCQPHAIPTSVSEKGDPTASDESLSASESPVEGWDLIYLQNQPVGWQSLRLSHGEENGRKYLRGLLRSELTVERFGQTTKEMAEISSRQEPSGHLVDVRSVVGEGNGQTITTGRLEGERLKLEARQPTDQRQWEILIPPDCGGCFAVEWSLRNKPLEPGEERQLRALVPLIHQVATIELAAAAQWTQMAIAEGEEQKLLPVHQKMALEGQAIDSTLWMDADGVIWKTEIPALQQITLRTTESEARRIMGSASFDLGGMATVRVARDLPSPHDTTRIRYRIRCSSPEGLAVIPQNSEQLIQPIDAQTIDVTVDRMPAEQTAGRDAESDRPTDADLLPSQMIQSDDAEVRALAAQVPQLKGQLATSIRAQAIEKFVHGLISKKNFSTAFGSAAEVARRREGDCTEHAVLTAALCRAVGIPARIVMGLVYVPSEKGFVFHMWNEIWNGQRWQSIDSTLGLGHIGAAHLVISRTSLETEATWASLLPVLSVMGQMQIEVLEVVPEQ